METGGQCKIWCANPRSEDADLEERTERIGALLAVAPIRGLRDGVKDGLLSALSAAVSDLADRGVGTFPQAVGAGCKRSLRLSHLCRYLGPSALGSLFARAKSGVPLDNLLSRWPWAPLFSTQQRRKSPEDSGRARPDSSPTSSESLRTLGI